MRSVCKSRGCVSKHFDNNSYSPKQNTASACEYRSPDKCKFDPDMGNLNSRKLFKMSLEYFLDNFKLHVFVILESQAITNNLDLNFTSFPNNVEARHCASANTPNIHPWITRLTPLASAWNNVNEDIYYCQLLTERQKGDFPHKH